MTQQLKVKSKGPDDNQVNAIAGFGHQIMRKPFHNHIDDYVAIS